MQGPGEIKISKIFKKQTVWQENSYRAQAGQAEIWGQIWSLFPGTSKIYGEIVESWQLEHICPVLKFKNNLVELNCLDTSYSK